MLNFSDIVEIAKSIFAESSCDPVALDKHNTVAGDPTQPLRAPGDPEGFKDAEGPHKEVGGYHGLVTQKPHGRRVGTSGGIGKQTLSILLRAGAKLFNDRSIPEWDKLEESTYEEVYELADAKFKDLDEVEAGLPKRGAGENLNVDDVPEELIRNQWKRGGNDRAAPSSAQPAVSGEDGVKFSIPGKSIDDLNHLIDLLDERNQEGYWDEDRTADVREIEGLIPKLNQRGPKTLSPSAANLLLEQLEDAAVDYPDLKPLLRNVRNAIKGGPERRPQEAPNVEPKTRVAETPTQSVEEPRRLVALPGGGESAAQRAPAPKPRPRENRLDLISEEAAAELRRRGANRADENAVANLAENIRALRDNIIPMLEGLRRRKLDIVDGFKEDLAAATDESTKSFLRGAINRAEWEEIALAIKIDEVNNLIDLAEGRESKAELSRPLGANRRTVIEELDRLAQVQQFAENIDWDDWDADNPVGPDGREIAAEDVSAINNRKELYERAARIDRLLNEVDPVDVAREIEHNANAEKLLREINGFNDLRDGPDPDRNKFTWLAQQSMPSAEIDPDARMWTVLDSRGTPVTSSRAWRTTRELEEVFNVLASFEGDTVPTIPDLKRVFKERFGKDLPSWVKTAKYRTDSYGNTLTNVPAASISPSTGEMTFYPPFFKSNEANKLQTFYHEVGHGLDHLMLADSKYFDLVYAPNFGNHYNPNTGQDTMISYANIPGEHIADTYGTLAIGGEPLDDLLRMFPDTVRTVMGAAIEHGFPVPRASMERVREFFRRNPGATNAPYQDPRESLIPDAKKPEDQDEVDSLFLEGILLTDMVYGAPRWTDGTIDGQEQAVAQEGRERELMRRLSSVENKLEELTGTNRYQTGYFGAPRVSNSLYWGSTEIPNVRMQLAPPQPKAAQLALPGTDGKDVPLDDGPSIDTLPESSPANMSDAQWSQLRDKISAVGGIDIGGRPASYDDYDEGYKLYASAINSVFGGAPLPDGLSDRFWGNVDETIGQINVAHEYIKYAPSASTPGSSAALTIERISRKLDTLGRELAGQVRAVHPAYAEVVNSGTSKLPIYSGFGKVHNYQTDVEWENHHGEMFDDLEGRALDESELPESWRMQVLTEDGKEAGYIKYTKIPGALLKHYQNTSEWDGPYYHDHYKDRGDGVPSDVIYVDLAAMNRDRRGVGLARAAYSELADQGLPVYRKFANKILLAHQEKYRTNEITEPQTPSDVPGHRPENDIFGTGFGDSSNVCSIDAIGKAVGEACGRAVQDVLGPLGVPESVEITKATDAQTLISDRVRVYVTDQDRDDNEFYNNLNAQQGEYGSPPSWKLRIELKAPEWWKRITTKRAHKIEKLQERTLDYDPNFVTIDPDNESWDDQIVMRDDMPEGYAADISDILLPEVLEDEAEVERYLTDIYMNDKPKISESRFISRGMAFEEAAEIQRLGTTVTTGAGNVSSSLGKLTATADRASQTPVTYAGQGSATAFRPMPDKPSKVLILKKPPNHVPNDDPRIQGFTSYVWLEENHQITPDDVVQVIDVVPVVNQVGKHPIRLKPSTGYKAGEFEEYELEPLRPTQYFVYRDTTAEFKAGMAGSEASKPEVETLEPTADGRLFDTEPYRFRPQPAELTPNVSFEDGYAYHVTNAERLREIAEDGKLRAHRPDDFTDQEMWPDGSTERRVYLGDSNVNFLSFAPEDGTPVIIRTNNTSGLKREGTTGDFIHTGDMSTEGFEYLDQDGRWHKLTEIAEPKTLAIADGAKIADDDLMEMVRSGDVEAWWDEDLIRADGKIYALEGDDPDAPATLKEIEQNEVTAPEGQSLIIFEHKGESYLLEGDEDLESAKPVDEWLREVGNDESAWKYVGEIDFNGEFWRAPGVLYHNTELGSLGGIAEDGIGARNESRGLANRGIGSAVFTSLNEEFGHAGHYGPAQFVIDAEAMKEDGYTPEVQMETGLKEAEELSALAHLLGAYDFEPDFTNDDGLDPDTVVVNGSIPLKYIKLQGLTDEEWAKLRSMDPDARQELVDYVDSIDELSTELHRMIVTDREGAGRRLDAAGYQEILDDNGGEDLENLPGSVNVPNVGRLRFGSNKEIQDIAEAYNKEHGLGGHPTEYIPVDKERAELYAAAYDEMEHNPEDPEVKAAYQALKDEALEQYKALIDAGYEFEFYPEGVDPYPNSPREAVLDLHQNKHMFVYPTLGDESGFGSEGEGTAADHPLLEQTGLDWGGRPVTYNDIFRAIHDVYGHAKEGLGFRHDGEDNAWRQHAAMFSPAARRAMTSETRGQNSWLNFGPYAEHNQTANQADTIFAEQKAGLMPEWVESDTALPDVGTQDTSEGLAQPLDDLLSEEGIIETLEGLSDSTRKVLMALSPTEMINAIRLMNTGMTASEAIAASLGAVL